MASCQQSPTHAAAPQILKTTLGGVEIPAVCLGLMGMSEFYGPLDEAESIATINAALDAGVNFLDTSDAYGSGENERLLGKVIKTRKRSDFFIATKFGILRDEKGGFSGLSGKKEYVKEACQKSLERLGVDYIDLYYLHRVDPKTPIEETVTAMAELVKEGKVRHLGLSEVSAATLRKAHAIHPIAALQSEYSLWTLDPEKEVLPACKELGIRFVAYSPLGRGFLSGKIKSIDDLAADDYRRNNPRFQGDNFAKNMELVKAVEEFAKVKNCTPSQLALAWIFSRGDHIIPLFGTKKRVYLFENLGFFNCSLNEDDLKKIEQILNSFEVAGPRYPAFSMATVNQ
eukprot:TRINITY_DN3748_c1_g3_i3.p1 TRINITY_DN3748_c1_g3~~TRINITY_DN3748_c1_g3_i3.p1  ORF type:complete len:357 (+),score=135.88 TRINITY_DN3748_c1_g3_i3:45-1073(+)